MILSKKKNEESNEEITYCLFDNEKSEIDVKSMFIYLSNRKNNKTFINSKTKINYMDWENIHQMIGKFGYTEVIKCFSNSSGELWEIELFCRDCLDFFNANITKTKLLEFFKNQPKKAICPCCSEKTKQKHKEQEKLSQKQNEKTTLQNTEYYIETYLDPNRSWKKGTKVYEMWNQVDVKYGYDWNIIKDHIKKMNYRDFLKTPYWKTVAQKKKHQCAYKCQLCNSGENLQTHHRTYDTFGEEIFNMKDLTVLCDACHAKHHDK